MESCILCLEILSDKLNCIRTDSKRWTELNIANTVEKHFWPLNTIRFNSFICSPCWRMVEDFHKFYLRIEEVHMKILIKVEKENVNDFCFQMQTTDQSIGDLNIDVNIKNEPVEVFDGDVESMSDMTCVEDIDSRKDKFDSQKFSKIRKRKCCIEKSLEIKKKAINANDGSETASDHDEDNIEFNFRSDTSCSDSNEVNTEKDLERNKSRADNDKLIISFLKHINCNICNVQVENFSALRKHFLEVHQQKGYIFCCNRKFFRQTDLADHIYCHLNSNYFRCAQCGKIYSGRTFLEQHKLRAHESEKITEGLCCDVCSKLYSNAQSLKIHKLSHLPPGSQATNLCKERNKICMSFTENNFEEPFTEIPQGLNANHSTSEPRTSSTTTACSKNDNDKTDDVFAILKEIARGQKACNNRLRKLEQNQTKMLQHESLLNNGQVVIVNNQQLITDTMEKLVASIVSKPEMVTQAKLLAECKVSIKKVEESVCRMTSNTSDKMLNEIGSMLPLQSLAAVQEVEQKLENADFAQAMMSYLHKVKGTSEDVNSVIRTIFTDDLLEKFNWEGRWEKQALGKLMLFNKTLRDVFQQQKAFDFEKSVRKAVERSHHRVNQKKYIKKENK